MSITSITTRNFRVVGTSKKMLGIDVSGPVLLLFTADGCQGCAEFSPIFNNLANVENRARCIVINISHNREVIAMSRQTVSPITVTPTLVFYNNGIPIAKFSKRKDIRSIRESITKIQGTPGYARSQRSQPQSQRGRYQQPGASTQFVHSEGQGGMYGGGGYSQQQQHSANRHTIKPEFSQMPNMSGINNNYVEDDDDMKLNRPNAIIPYNLPWEATDTFD